VSESAWLERLLVSLGPDATVVAPPALVDVGAAAAARLRGRYGGPRAAP
jgi:predicted DNA-binding transcriptional regulator YafY